MNSHLSLRLPKATSNVAAVGYPLVVMDLIKQYPLSPLVAKHMADINTPIAYTDEEAKEVLLTLFLGDVEVNQVNVTRNRTKYSDFSGYIGEMSGESVARVVEILVQGACGVRWGEILGGKGYHLLTWLVTTYPFLALAKQKMDEMRCQAIAERALDRLEGIADEAEQDNARVKACEVLLRATHSAFGAKTLAKVGDNRPTIVFNIANIFGDSSTKDGRKTAEIIDGA